MNSCDDDILLSLHNTTTPPRLWIRALEGGLPRAGEEAGLPGKGTKGCTVPRDTSHSSCPLHSNQLENQGSRRLGLPGELAGKAPACHVHEVHHGKGGDWHY